MANNPNVLRNLKPFQPGFDPRRGNGPRPRFLSQFTKKGYQQGEVIDAICILLELTDDEIQDCLDNPKATMLEKMVAGALQKSVKEKTLEAFEPLLNRAFGKPQSQLNITNIQPEQQLTIDYYKQKLVAGVDRELALSMALEIAKENGIKITEKLLLEAGEND